MVFKWWRRLKSVAWLGVAVLPFWSLPVSAQTGPPVPPTLANANAAEPALGAPRTRFVIGLERATQFQVFSLTNPNRVIVDVADTRLRLPPQPEGGPSGLVQSFRGGQSAPGQSRVVIDVTVPVVVESAKIETGPGKTHALTLEIAPVDAPAPRKAFKEPPYALGAAGLQPPMPQPAVRPEIRAAKAYKPVIVIDPGHGGDDSGAEKNGAVEKEVVLAFGKALKAKLEATGAYKVVMTRDTDVFVPLGERLTIADRNAAELFIAVHADYAGGNSKARGATIYSLRDSVADALKRSAKDEVASRAQASIVQKAVQNANDDVDTIKSMLAELAERFVNLTQHSTNEFSGSVIETMGESTPLRDDPDQQAAFRVLKTAQFPSVLIELAYVTNKEDAENLKSDAWRDKVADSIVNAVSNYFSHRVARLPQ